MSHCQSLEFESAGVRQTPAEYVGQCKVLYILYHDCSLRDKIFCKLGVSPPSTLHPYKQYVTKMQDGGILGLYKVVDAYLEIRGSGNV